MPVLLTFIALPVVIEFAVTLSAFPAVVLTEVKFKRLPAPVVDEPVKSIKFPVNPVVVPDCVTLSAVELTCDAFEEVITRPLAAAVCEIVAAVAAPVCATARAVAAVPVFVPFTVNPTTPVVAGVIVLAAVVVGTCMR